MSFFYCKKDKKYINENIKDTTYKNDKNINKKYKRYKCFECITVIKNGDIYFAMDKTFCTDNCRLNYINKDITILNILND